MRQPTSEQGRGAGGTTSRAIAWLAWSLVAFSLELQLKVELRKAKERLRHKRDVILGYIRQLGFEV